MQQNMLGWKFIHCCIQFSTSQSQADIYDNPPEALKPANTDRDRVANPISNLSLFDRSGAPQRSE